MDVGDVQLSKARSDNSRSVEESRWSGECTHSKESKLK